MANDPNDKTISVLNGLIETCKDGAKGFSTASDDAKAEDLKLLFATYSSQRSGFAMELERFVTDMRGDAPDTGHIAGAIHRGWINLKAAVSGNDDKAILNECERGEDYAKKAYTDALKEHLPPEIRSAVEQQSVAVKAAHDRVRDLRDHANARADATPSLEPREPVYHE